MNEEPLYDKIDAYLQGKMAPAERTAFEQKITTEPGLKKEVELARKERLALRAMLEDELAGQLKNWDWEKVGRYKPLPGDGPEGENKNGRRRRWPWLFVLLALLLAGLLFFLPSREGNRQGGQEGTTVEPDVPGPKGKPEFQQENTAPQEQKSEKAASPIAGEATPGLSPEKDFIAMAEAFYSPTVFAAGRREDGTPAAAVDTLGAATAAYHRKELQKTIGLLERVGEENPNYITAQLLLGRAFFESGAYEKAGLAFQRVMDSPYEQLAEEALWLRVLSYLAAGRGESKAFRQLLERIIDESNQHPQREKAVRLKEEWLD